MIVNHPTSRFTLTKWPFEDSSCLVVKCDFCGTMASYAGHNAGEAAEQAFRCGFKLVRGARLSDPKKWSCGCA